MVPDVVARIRLRRGEAAIRSTHFIFTRLNCLQARVSREVTPRSKPSYQSPEEVLLADHLYLTRQCQDLTCMVPRILGKFHVTCALRLRTAGNERAGAVNASE